MSGDGLKRSDSQDPLCLLCGCTNYLCVGILQKIGSKIPAASKTCFLFFTFFLGSASVAHILLMVFLSWSTFGPSERVTWGAGDEARERGQTSTYTHTLYALVVVPFFHLHHFSCFGKATQ